MSALADKLNALRVGGFPEAEVGRYAEKRRRALTDAGFRDDEIDAALGVRQPEMNEARKALARANAMLERHAAEQKAHAETLKRGAADIARTVAGDAETPSLYDYFDYGFQMSVSGLIARGQLPERPDKLPEGKQPGYAGHLATQAGTLAGDLPAMVAGAVAGAPAGAAVAGPPGALAGGFGGAFALPAMLRRGLMDEYEKGTVTSWAEYWDRVLAIAVDGLKGFATGAATGTAGGFAKPGAERLAVEVATMVSVGAALEGEVPEPRDFADALILILGFKAGMKTVEAGYGKLRKIYAETGATPAEVAADARRDPTIAEDLASDNIDIPRAYRDRVEEKAEPVPQAEPETAYRPVDAEPEVVTGEPVPLPEAKPQSPAGVSRAVARFRREAIGDEVKEPENIVEFLRRLGGVRETDTYRGDLRALDLHLTKRGQKPFLNEKGMELDDARRIAEEHHYLPEGAEVRDLLDAIDQTLRGKPLYSAEDATRAAEYQEYTRGLDAFERYRSQFESDGEMLSWARMERENWEIEREGARAYTDLERAAREHLEPEELYRAEGEALTLGDLEKIDAAIRESDRVNEARAGDGGKSAVAGERAEPGASDGGEPAGGAGQSPAPGREAAAGGLSRGGQEPAREAAGEIAPARQPWPAEFPPAALHHSGGARGAPIKKHPLWKAAKTGDVAAAAALVRDLIRAAVVDGIRQTLAGRRPIVVPVHAVDGSRNRIPAAYARRLADALDLEVDTNIVQVVAGRTDLGRAERLTKRAAFDGEVEPGRDYLIVDDHVTSGGTIAELRAHIEAGGGKVVLVSALSGNAKGAILRPSPEALASVRQRFPELEAWWRERFGYELEGLTHGEVEYLRSFSSFDALRDRLAAGGPETGRPGTAGNPSARETGVEAVEPERPESAAPDQVNAGPPAPAAGGGGQGAGAPPPPPARPQLPGPGEPAQLPPPSDAVATVLSRTVVGGKTPRRRWWDVHRLYTDWVNDQHPLSLAFKAMAGKGEGVAPSENFVTLARLFRGAMGKPEHFLEVSPFKFSTYENIGESFRAIIRPIFEAGDQNNLRAYLLARRALDYHRRGLESGIDLAAARTVVADLARLAPVARRLERYQDHVLDYLRDAGVLSAEQVAQFRDANRDYVPFFRHLENVLAGSPLSRGMQARNPIRRVTGSDLAIVDPLESIVKNTYALIMAAEQNSVARSYVDFAAKHGGEWAQRVPVKVRPIEVSRAEIAKIIETFVVVTRRARKTVSETEETSSTGGGQAAAGDVRAAKVRATAQEALEARGFSAAEATQILDRIAASKSDAAATVIEKTVRRVERMEVEQELGALVAEAGFTIFRPVQRGAGIAEIVVWRAGKRELWRVPVDIAEVFKGLHERVAGTLLQILATPAKFLRAGAVLSPEFIGRNPFRDQLSAFVNSDALYAPFVHLAFGIKSLARGRSGAFDRDFSDWLKGGGSLATLVSMDRPTTQKSLARLAGETNFMDAARNVVTSPLQLLQALSSASEQGTRIGVFRANTPAETRVRPFASEASARPRTKDEILTGALQARESSLDFRRRGAQAQAVNMLVAFWNAAVQGTDKTIRTIRDHPARTTARVAAAITLPSVLLYLHNRDDPRYRDLAQWERDLFWIIITDDKVWRFPKPFDLGVVFGTGAERVAEWMLTRDPHAFDDLLATAGRSSVPGLVPTAGLPIAEQFANRSLFTDRPIVPYSTERLLPQYQYAPYTTELAKAIGAGVASLPGMRHSSLASPAILENYVRAWTGGLGVHVLKLADAGLRAAGVLPDPNLPASTWADIPFVKAFIVREPSLSAEPVSKFFDRYERQAREAATVKALARQGDIEAAQMELDRSGGGFADVEDIKRTISDAIKLTRDVAKDPNMTPDDKRQIIDQLTVDIVWLAKAGNARLDQAEKALQK